MSAGVTKAQGLLLVGSTALVIYLMTRGMRSLAAGNVDSILGPGKFLGDTRKVPVTGGFHVFTWDGLQWRKTGELPA